MTHEQIITIKQLQEYRDGYRPTYIPNTSGNSMMDLLFRPLLAGTICETEMGKMILPQQLSMWLFRGQTKEYPSWNASIFRIPTVNDNFDSNSRIFYRELQLSEFELFINNLPRVEDWRNRGFFVNAEALAQHYGLYSTMIDITNDFDIALFFACCKYEYKTNSYRPLNRDDINNSDDEYGVIYRKIAFEHPFHHNNNEPAIIPIGFQPFLRPQNQCGFIICDNDNKNIPNYGFDLKIKFKHDLNFSREIFNEFDGGEKIFTKTDVSYIEKHILNIRDGNTFSIEAFEKTCKELNYPEPKMKSALNKNGINVGAKPYNLSIGELEKIDKNWNFDSFIKQCGISLRQYEILREEDVNKVN